LLSTDEDVASNQKARDVADYGREHLGQLWALATSHHVIMRTFPTLYHAMTMESDARSRWLENALKTERTRIRNALCFLAPICEALEDAGEVIVIKSLDHWPDLGNDLDIYTTARSAEVVSIMRERFRAQLAERSWGDRLARKWNFIVPGLPELVEVHFGRLGQTGEQVAIAACLMARARTERFGSHAFRVPSGEDRVMISTLQRMYRHFYLRLCDIANIARLADLAGIDYTYLESVTRPAGLWDGLAAYLVILTEYVERYRERGIALPPSVVGSVRFRGASVSFRQRFLRIPIFPQAAKLYAKEWTKLLCNGELQSTLRLSLLPGLAVAAALRSKLTGSDKGIW
jgi:hypothetical protein